MWLCFDYMDLCQQMMSLLFNMLSRFVITFLPRSKHLLVSWLQSPSAVILEPKKRKSVPFSTFPPSICHEMMGPDALILDFFFPFIFISWRLITLQYYSSFCHTLTWISHGFTCIPHPDPPSHPPLYPIPLGLPSAPGPSTCLMHPTWAGDLFHLR